MAGKRGTPDRLPSRRRFLIGGAGIAASASVPAMAVTAGQASAETPSDPIKKKHSTITTKDGTPIYYNDWDSVQTLVFSHSWPVSADAFEDQMFFSLPSVSTASRMTAAATADLASPWTGQHMDAYADDLHELVTSARNMIATRS
jgi:non-heme chloroperoxidase